MLKNSKDKGNQTIINSKNIFDYLRDPSNLEEFHEPSFKDSSPSSEEAEGEDSSEEFHEEIEKDSYIICLDENGITKVKGNKSYFEYIEEGRVLDEHKGKYDLVILVTAYNETFNEYNKTLKGIEQNLPQLLKTEEISIAVIFIVDGIVPFVKTTTIPSSNSLPSIKSTENQYLEIIDDLDEDGFETFFHVKDLKILASYFNKFQSKPKNIKNKNSNKEYAYLFCNTKICQDETEPKIKIENSLNLYHYTLIFCIKHENKKKINTQKWFLKGFCKVLQPETIIFLDVGTVPLPNSIKTLYDCFKNDSNIAGCCGEIIPENPVISNFIQEAQVIEYKFSHLFDKSFESLFGYVSVLPGAFSAYRFSCFQEDLMNVYFFADNHKDISLFSANMYLAEDRILCLELMCQKGRANLLTYLPDAKATTDVPSELSGLMKQRRRWINGSWFSLIYTIINWNKIYHSDHTSCQKFLFFILNIYYAANALFTWLFVGTIYLCMAITVSEILDKDNNPNKLDRFSTPFIMFYVSTLIAMMVCAISVNPEKIKNFLNILAGIYGIYTYGTLFSLFILFLKDDTVKNLKEWQSTAYYLIVFFTCLLVLAVTVRHFKSAFVPIVVGIFQYLCLTGAYANIFLIYSICNIHDVSWGNRPDKDEANEQNKDYEAQRVFWVALWILSNSCFAVYFTWDNGKGSDTDIIDYFTLIIFLLIFVKVLGGFLFLFRRKCCFFRRRRGHIKKVIDSQDLTARGYQSMISIS